MAELSNKLKAFVEGQLPKVLRETSLDEGMVDALEEYVMRGGKRIRPVLLLLSARLFSDEPSFYDDIALALELFHNFTLIHDDIEDGSPYRRGKPTLHMLYGVPVAINLGDALHIAVWEILTKKDWKGKERPFFSEIGKTFMNVAKGQQIELTLIHEERLDVPYEEYYRLTENKTGVLLALSLALPSLEKDERVYRELYEATKKLGVAFQIQDDLLNIMGDFEKYKKKIGDDITEGKRTLLVLYAIKNFEDTKSARLRELLLKHTEDEAEIKEAIGLIKESGAVEFAKGKAEKLIQEALPKVEALLPEGEAKKEILDIIHFFIHREV